MATTTTPSAPTIDDVQARYSFREPEAVVDFLAACPHVVPLLIEARPVIDRHFGAETPVVLEVVPDRESGDEEDNEVFALIQTGLPHGEAMPRLDRFDEWWLTNVGRALNRLEFGLWYR